MTVQCASNASAVMDASVDVGKVPEQLLVVNDGLAKFLRRADAHDSVADSLVSPASHVERTGLHLAGNDAGFASFEGDERSVDALERVLFRGRVRRKDLETACRCLVGSVSDPAKRRALESGCFAQALLAEVRGVVSQRRAEAIWIRLVGAVAEPGATYANPIELLDELLQVAARHVERRRAGAFA